MYNNYYTRNNISTFNYSNQYSNNNINYTNSFLQPTLGNQINENSRFENSTNNHA